MKISVLYVIENKSYRGGEKSFEDLICHLDKEKYALYLATNPTGPFFENAKNHATVIPLYLHSKFNLLSFIILYRMMKQCRIAIVHSQGARADFYARISAFLAGVPVIVSTIAMPPEGFDVPAWKKYIYVFFDRLTEKIATHFIVCSQALKKSLTEDHHIEPNKITVIYNAVDRTKYLPTAALKETMHRELSIPASTLIIGTICSLVWQKGIEYFIKAVALLKDQPLPATVAYVIAGDGPELHKLQNLAQALQVHTQIHFLGFRSDTQALLSAFDIFVLPSLREGQPFALLEAMAAQKPIITTDIPGVNETIVHNRTGLLVPPAQSAELADALSVLIKDKSKSDVLARNAYAALSESFDYNAMIQKYEALYDSLSIQA